MAYSFLSRNVGGLTILELEPNHAKRDYNTHKSMSTERGAKIFFNKKGCAHGFYFRNAAENIIVTILSLADRVSFSMLSPAEQVIKLVSTK